MAREFDKVKRLANDMYQNIPTGGGAKEVSELPENGEENTIYKLTKDIADTTPIGLKFIRVYNYTSSSLSEIREMQYMMMYVDTFEHLDNITFF